MGTRAFGLIATLTFAGVTISAQKNQMYSGAIMDGVCGSTGLHDAMMKMASWIKKHTVKLWR